MAPLDAGRETVQFGLQMLMGTRYYTETAAIAEEFGFSSLHVPDHLVYPAQLPDTYPYADDGVLRINGEPIFTDNLPCYDPFVLLGHLAACTHTVELVPSVCIVPLYHPLFLARALATVDRLSGGRVALGVGVGWLDAEFAAAGQGFHDRGKRTDRILELLDSLWADELIETDDEWYEFGPVRFNPKPLRGRIPRYVGGDSPAALRRAATRGDGWLDIGSNDLDASLAKVATIRRLRAESGRADLPFEVAVTSTVAPDRDSVARAAEHGVTRVIAMPSSIDGKLTADSVRSWAERYADDVMSKV